MTRPTYGSLFSGVGGMDMGFDTHMDCVFQVEWDKNCQSVLNRHWPDVPKWYDVQDVNGAEVPPCDVLTFGSPCQDLSVAGKRAGLDGNRSSMFFEAIRIIKEMRNATASRPTGPLPRAVVWENVPGALSSNNGEDFQAVLEALGDIGAVDIQWSVLDAQHFGVPQRRRRIFLVAIFDPATADRCDGPLLPVCEGRARDFAKGRKKGEGSTGGAEASPDGSGEGYRMLGFGHYTADDTAFALKQRDYKDATDLAVIPFVKAKRAMSNTDDDRWEATETAPTLNAFDNGGESRATVLMPVAYSVREDAKANTFSATETDTALCLNGLVPSPQSHHAQLFIAETIIFDEINHDDLRVDSERQQNPMLAFDPGTIGPLTSTGMSRARGTESIESSHVLAIDNSTPLGANPNDDKTIIFENSFRDGARINDDISHTLPAKMGLGGGNQPHVAQPTTTATMAVRRLTPLECERLMGWPDDHTRYTDTGKEQADTHRYKQCGNGVASPVARWIAQQLTKIL